VSTLAVPERVPAVPIVRTRSVQVLQVVLSLRPGGTERLAIELSRRLHDAHGMHVCCLDEAGEWAGELRDCGISVTSLGRVPGFSPSLGHAIARVASRHGATVLHCHQYSPFVYGTIARLWHRAGLVFTEHGRASDAPPSRKRALVNQALSRLPAEVFCVSDDLRRHLGREGFPARRVGIIHNGIGIGPLPDGAARLRARKRLGVPAGALVVGAVGRLDPVKDLATLIQAFRTDAPRDARLVLIGDGPDRSFLESRLTEAGLRDRVLVTGYRQDVRELLPALDVYVNSSIFEGVSLTILEAMATALPVIATRVGGTPEVVMDEETGCLVPSRDAAALGRALRILCEDRGRAKRLGVAGRQRVEQHFSLDAMVAKYAAVYRKFERR
jgi:glycosyltransferase involved in cell wall biosynthesis